MGKTKVVPPAPTAQAIGKNLSENVAKITDIEWDVIVIGSGYGGSIAASRLARTGQKVCLLERGREFRPGQYPNSLKKAAEEMQAHFDCDKEGIFDGRDDGLFNVQFSDDINVLRGCGLGGTSLINAGVVLKADKRVFNTKSWPEGLRKEMDDKSFNAWYDKVKEVLEPSSYPDPKKLPKIEAMNFAATATGSVLKYPPIAVNFTEKINKVGLHQPACTDCGDCVMGCNVGAKNTLIMNYIPDAWNHGAKIYTGAEVRRISERQDGKEGWIVWYTNAVGARKEFHDAGSMFLQAKVVVVSGGTLGSAEIMLRSKREGLNISKSVGERFSGNGDLLAFGFDTEHQIEDIEDMHRRVGPCITTVIDRREAEDFKKGFVVEDGTHPYALATVYAGMLALTNTACKEKFEELLDITEDVLFHSVRTFGNSLSVLVMAQDSDEGELELKHDKLRVKWKNAAEEPFVEHAYDYLENFAKVLGGKLVPNPITSDMMSKKQLITVHPLGGCVMGDDPEKSVVNEWCQVWNPDGGVHKGLYIMDGAVIPGCVGINPFLTISAVSERAVHHLAEDYGWKIKEGYEASYPVPGKTIDTVGIVFTETMKGWFSVGEVSSFEDGKNKGKEADQTISFTLTISTDNLDEMIKSPQHEALITGTLKIPSLSPYNMMVTKGKFNLFIDDPDIIDQKLMLYRLEVVDVTGAQYLFTGYKEVKNNMFGLNTWSQTTTLYITLYDGVVEKPEFIKGKGMIFIEPLDFARQLTTMEILNAPDELTKLHYLVKFGRYFSGSLWEVYGSVSANTGDHSAPRIKRKLALPLPEIHDVITPDNFKLRLTRYNQPQNATPDRTPAGPTKGPLLMVHGMGVSSRIFLVDTIEVSAAEYFYARGYDVWLLDFRLSIDLPYAASITDLDVIANNDFAVSLDKIMELTGKKVDVLCHCAGSAVFFMAMCTGKLEGKVNQIIASQVATHGVSSTTKNIQSILHLPGFMDKMGTHSVNPSVDSGFFNKLTSNPLLSGVPWHERCSSKVCHRISFLYNLLWEHSQLNTATHDILHELFGLGSTKIFDHFATILRHKHIVNAKGDDVYLPRAAENLILPILFVSGSENLIWYPQSTELTYKFLTKQNNPKLYTRFVAKDYGHLDCIFGKHANVDIFPRFAEFLEKNQQQ